MAQIGVFVLYYLINYLQTKVRLSGADLPGSTPITRQFEQQSFIFRPRPEIAPPVPAESQDVEDFGFLDVRTGCSNKANFPPILTLCDAILFFWRVSKAVGLTWERHRSA